MRRIIMGKLLYYLALVVAVALISLQYVFFSLFGTTNADETRFIPLFVELGTDLLLVSWGCALIFLAVRPTRWALGVLLSSLILKFIGDFVDLRSPNWQLLAFFFTALVMAVWPLKLKTVSAPWSLGALLLNLSAIFLGAFSCEYQARVCHRRNPALADVCEVTRFHLECSGDRIGWVARGVLAARCMNTEYLTLKQTRNPFSCYGG